MKKNFLIFSLIMLLTSGSVFAAGMVFDPTEYSSATTVTPATKSNVSYATSTKAVSESTPAIYSAPKTNPVASSKSISNKTINSDIQSNSNIAQNAISGQSSSFNNALFELDTAQVNLRNELLEHKSKYQEVDTQYKLIKEQRKVLNSQIKTIENRIKDIENSKNKIRKTMI